MWENCFVENVLSKLLHTKRFVKIELGNSCNFLTLIKMPLCEYFNQTVPCTKVMNQYLVLESPFIDVEKFKNAY